NGFNRSNFVRLTSTGELDQSFNANVGGGFRIWLQPGGKYLLTGAYVFRRNTDGSADTSFVAPAFDTLGSNGRSIDAVVDQADGGMILVGRFDFAGTVSRHNIVRLTATGGLDGL